MQPGSRPGPSHGYTLVATLLLVAVVATGLAFAGPTWSIAAKRERERELLRIGVIYAQAIARYRDVSPGSVPQLPVSLDALLLDTRFVGTVRHLRRLYPDPVSPNAAWALVRDEQGRILGVRSQSSDATLAQGAVVLVDRVLAPARRYADWQFLALPTPKS